METMTYADVYFAAAAIARNAVADAINLIEIDQEWEATENHDKRLEQLLREKWT